MTKYKKVEKHLLSLINNKKIETGQKIPPENELADFYKVSRNTVRRALSEMVNEGYLFTKHGVGTFVNSTSNKTKNIGVISTYINDYIFPSVISGINDYLSENSYSIILSETKNNIEREMHCLENMLSKNIEGLIIEPAKSAYFPKNIEYYYKLIEKNIPIVLIHGYFDKHNFSHVIMDDSYSGYIATKFLIENNHKNIMGFFKNDDIQGINRYNGFLKAMNEYNLPITPNTISWFTTEDRNLKPSYEIKKIIESGEHIPSAIFCYNDQIAFSIIKVLKEYNINIPDDIAIIGHDDSFLAHALETKFTSIQHPKDKLGRTAAESLLKLINKEEEKIQKKIKGELIIRDSTKVML